MLLKNLNREKINPFVILPSDGPLVKLINNLNIKTFIVPLERWIRFSFDKKAKEGILERFKNIVKVIQDHNIDIVHTNTSVILEGALAAYYAGIKHVWHIHENILYNEDLKAVLPLPLVFKIISELSVKIICVSEFVKNQFEDYAPKEKLRLLYNSVNDDYEYNDKKNDKDLNDLKNELDLGNNSIIITTIGLLTQTKGYNLFLELSKITKEFKSDVKFIWIGHSQKNDLKKFNKFIKLNKLTKNVKFLGFREDIPKLLNISDIYLCTSDVETFSLTILEAKAAGIPSISTKCGGPSEIITEGYSGHIIEKNDIITFREKLIDMIQDKNDRLRLGQNARIEYDNKYSSSSFIKNIMELYEDVQKDINHKDSQITNELMENYLICYEQLSNIQWKNNK